MLLLPATERVDITTRDGARLRGRRYASPGVPVVLLHGLAANLHLFELGTDGAPSLAGYLHGLGYDVWLVNFRGAGAQELESLLPAGREGWTADDYIVADLPAVVNHVHQTTGQRPFLIGHSLGGMSIAAFLAGATLEDPTRPEAGVIIDRAVARKRNLEVRGAVFLSAPARLSWAPERAPKALMRFAKLTLRVHGSSILPRRLRFSRLNKVHSGEASPLVRRVVGRVESLLIRHLSESEFLAHILGRNREKALHAVESFRGQVLSDCSRGVLLQLARSLEAESWQSSPGAGGARLGYCDHYGLIRTSVLVAVGGDDSIADPVVLHEGLYERLTSPDRTALVFPGYGHTEVLLGESALEDVFRPLAAWLRPRSSD